ncbi:MAG: hypothetical protein KAJ33_06115 [Thermoplasmata archaeon]|nr:hypothetical protein [Thermoplasmata archaeon]
MAKVNEQFFIDTIKDAVDELKSKHADEIKALELEIAELKGELKFYKETHIKIVQTPAYTPFVPRDTTVPNELYPTITCSDSTGEYTL